ncbi:MAG: GAF domain-containing protein, partial [Acidimicrobiales bacterium]
MSDFLIDSVNLNPEQKLTVTSEFLNSISTGMIFRDARGVIVDCNRAAEEILCLSREKLVGITSADFEKGVIGLDGMPLSFDESWVADALESEGAHVVAGFEMPDKVRKWLSIRVWPAIVGGQVMGLMSAFDDVTREVKERRFLSLLTRVKDAASPHTGEDELLQRICDAIIAEGHYSLAWIGVAAGEGGVDIVCSSGATDYLYEGIVSWWGTSESGMGPTGTALRTATTQVAPDLLTQPLFNPWRQRAEQFGLSSMIALPIRLGSRPAAVSIYDAHISTFDELSIKGLETIAREIESCIEASISVRQRQVAVAESTAAANALKRAELSLNESEQ